MNVSIDIVSDFICPWCFIGKKRLKDALALVQEKNVSALPIVEENGKLCGLITRSSLMTTLSHQYLDNQEGGL